MQGIINPLGTHRPKLADDKTVHIDTVVQSDFSTLKLI